MVVESLMLMLVQFAAMASLELVVRKNQHQRQQTTSGNPLENLLDLQSAEG